MTARDWSTYRRLEDLWTRPSVELASRVLFPFRRVFVIAYA
jgi:hypothetical protein